MRPSSLALAGTILAGLLLLVATAALAHDHWIARDKYRSPVDNALCCGPNDTR